MELRLRRILLILLMMVLAVSSVGLADESGPVYRTLEGELYDIGTGEVPFLVFGTDAGDYLVANASYGSLEDLKGLPLLLTVKVTGLDGGNFLGQIEVEDYNTYYDSSCADGPGDDNSCDNVIGDDRSCADLAGDDSSCDGYWEEVSILGRLVDGGDNLVLLSRDQLVVELETDSYHSLGEYLGEEVVITGSLEKFDDYSGRMEVKSYRVLSGD